MVKVSITDPGAHDVHTAMVTWSDGITTSESSFIQQYTCSSVFVGTVFRLLQPDEQISMKSVIVWDDDSGVSQIRSRSLLGLDANSDDDNLNLLEDLSESGFDDDDLKSISLSQLLTNGMDLAKGTRYLKYDNKSVRIWDTQSKNNLIQYGSIHKSQDQVWVEGISSSRSEIFMEWVPNAGVNHGCSIYGTIVGHVIEVVVTSYPLDLDTDSDDTLVVDRSAYEDSIENTAGKGKKVFRRSAPAETILEANAFGFNDGYKLTLIVSPGLNVWADSAKTARLTSPNFVSIPNDDTQSESYTWTSWVGLGSQMTCQTLTSLPKCWENMIQWTWLVLFPTQRPPLRHRLQRL